MNRVWQVLALVAPLALSPATLWAQALASLLADSVSVDADGRLTASGNVTVWHEGTQMRAERVIYDPTTDRLTIEGAITITDPNGTTLSAEAATLSRSLQDGLLTSARLVLDQQLQLAAADIRRVDGRYTALEKVVASSCQVCATHPTPLWEIRAGRVIHDAEGQQLYFENAQVRVAGVPVFYLPRMRLPDPTLKRATGFLIPRFRSLSEVGTGVKVPYFLTFGDHADVTLTPYLSSRTETLEYRYRQLVRNGALTVEGAATNDDILGGRGYLFADGVYYLPRGFVARGQLEFVSDPGYLFAYGYSEKDRLTNELAFGRVRDKDLFRASITEFRTLRESEIPIRDTLPDRFVEVGYTRDLERLAFGGRTTLNIDAAALNRPSSVDGDGRDVSRIGLGLEWSRDGVFGPGVVGRVELGVRADAYNVGQDTNFATNDVRALPRAAIELRWPFQQVTATGARDVIEPILRLDVTDRNAVDVPLEDSRIVEFDEGNLFSPSRYPGIDGAEEGARAAVGAVWHRGSPEGWTADIALGRVARLDGSLGYEDGSGLSGDQSEWLIAARLGIGDNLWLATRSLFDDNVSFTLSETRLDWSLGRAELASSYIFAQPEPAE
jgi:LPS-assembly protein